MSNENRNKNFIERKIQLAKFDLETAFHCNNKHTSQITSIRGWCISLVVAYLGFVFSKSDTQVALSLLSPVYLVIISFFYLEFNEKIAAKLNAKNVRLLESILSENNEEIFEEKISKYVSRDIYIKQKGNTERKEIIIKTLKEHSVYHWPLFMLFSTLAIWYVLNNIKFE